MRRYIAGSPVVLDAQFRDSSGTLIDATGPVTIQVTRADSTVLVGPGAATTHPSTGAYRYTIPAALNTLLDTLTVKWSGTFSGQAQTKTDTVEIAGAFLFTDEQFRVALGSSPDAVTIAEARAYAETELESMVGYALVPRYALERLPVPFGWGLPLKPYVRSIRSVTSNGVPLAAQDVALLSYDWSMLTGYAWKGATVVGYEHGLDGPPPGATRAALDEAVVYAGGGGGTIDPRATRLVTADGTIELQSFATAGGLLSTTAAQWAARHRLPVVA